MFVKAFESALSHTGVMTQIAKAGICYSRCGGHFYNRHQQNQNVNPYLLYNFSKDNTLRALEQAQESANPAYQIDQKDLITFDKLSENMNSETHRVFDLYNKKFFALKTLTLDSESGWKQLNLMLRQHFYERSRLAPVHSFSYNEANKEVKILSGIQKTIIGEYAYNRKRQGLPWSTQELKTVMCHLLKIVKALKVQGASTDYLKAGHIFFDSKEGKLRAFDYPGAEIGNRYFGFWGWSDWKVNNLDVALHTLVQIIDPYAPVDNAEEARAYININYPEFKSELSYIERHSRGSGFFHEDLLPLDQIFEMKGNDNILLGKVKKILDEKYLFNTQENWAFVNQGLGKFDEASLILKNLLAENANKYGPTHPTVTKSYLNLAELYYDQGNYDLSSQYFQNAFNTSHSTPVFDKDVLARLSLSYGKLLLKLNKDNTKSAMNEFQKAQNLLKDIPNGSARLKKEIQKVLDDLNDSGFGYFNNQNQNHHDHHEHWEKRKLKKRKFWKILLTLICLKIIYNKWNAYHKKHCQKPREQDSLIEPCRPTVAPPQNNSTNNMNQSQNTSSFVSLTLSVEPEPTAAITVKSQKVVPVEPNLSKIAATTPAAAEPHQDSKFGWFLFGLNVAIGFAGLTLPSVN